MPDEVTLPGSLDEQGIGNPVREIHMGKLTSGTRYVGSAWYQKEVEIPDSWIGRRIELYLERAYRETTVYVDGVHTPTRNSLSTPHIHDLTGLLGPGKHCITIHVDNKVKINLGHTYGNMLWLHALTEETQTNWNGVIGNIELISTPRVWIRELQAYPDFAKNSTRISNAFGNQTGNKAACNFELLGLPDENHSREISFSFHGKDTLIEVTVPFGESPRYWDEFNPELYGITASLSTIEGKDQKALRFGLRDFKAVNQHFELNGQRIFLRGEVNCCIFPLTGYPPMKKEGWAEVFGIYKDYGLNHVRFHSWCPPEAAFQAADELGIIVLVEPPLWDGFGLVGFIPERASYILAEADRIVDTYGHHPSFCLMSMGNELGDGSDPFLAYLVDYLRKKDPRHLYTSTTQPAGMERNDDYFNAAGTGKGVCRGIYPFKDYREVIEELDRPLITHEVGQPAMYPDFGEITKYSGHLKARNFEVFRESLEEKGMINQAEDFRRASGAFLVEIYKENIEAQLRTPNVAGFQLLGLQDFTGQGVAIVGVLDPFLESKGLISSESFRRFCSATVPLIRMPGFVYTNNQVLKAKGEIAHYGKEDLHQKPVHWQVLNQEGKVMFSGEFPVLDIPTETTTGLGTIEADLSRFKKPEQLTIQISIPGTDVGNSWKVWVYPDEKAPEIPKGILVTDQFNTEARKTLLNGGNVLVIPEHETLENVEKSRWHPVFWSYQLFKQPKVMGILCDPSHPALKAFPTDFHSDWQWHSLLDHSEALVIDKIPQEFNPIIQFVPDFNTNHKLSVLMEARVGSGGLMVCNIDLLNDNEHPESSHQLLKSILEYMQSNQLKSAPKLEIDLIDELLRVTPKIVHESKEPNSS
ncbi:MAG: glycoside hydrolase family 2 [Bacteroidetes bacterium]|nr:glycoside hydrolase family 2 [Bacteroidota bacterium]